MKGERIQLHKTSKKSDPFLRICRRNIRLVSILCMACFLASDTIADRRHPDGLIGKPSLTAIARYSSVTAKQGTRASDIQSYRLESILPVHPRLSFNLSWLAAVSDTTRHDFQVGTKIYLGSFPLRQGDRVNPDGPIGGLVLNLGGGPRFSSGNFANRTLTGHTEIDLPVSTFLSVHGGFRAYEKVEPGDLEEYYFGFSIFPRPYGVDSAYANPDGSVGIPNLRIQGGGSSRGVLLSVTSRVPLSRDLTVLLNIVAERFKADSRRAVSAAIGLTIHPK